MHEGHVLVRVFAVAAWAALAALSLNGCTTLQDLIRRPTVKSVSMHVVGVDFQTLKLRFDVGVENGSSGTLMIAGYDYDLHIEGRPFLNGMSDEGIELKPRSVTTIPVPVVIPFSDLVKTLDSLKPRQDVAYDLAVALMVKTGLGNFRLPLQKEGRLPVLTLPQVRLQGVKMDALTLKGASLEVAVEIATSPQPAIALTNLTYALTFNEAKVAAGTVAPEPATGKGAQLVRIPVHLDIPSVRSILGSGSSGQERVTVKLTGEANFTSPYGTLTLPFTQTGRLLPSR